MLSKFLQLAVLSLGALSAIEAGSLSTGQYFRPTGDQVSGERGSSAPYHRSPCPALNTLANHGFIPRDGRKLTPVMLRDAVMRVYNIDKARADSQTNGLADAVGKVFTLADLSKHNFIEHDVSLVHADLSFGFDPAHVDSVLAQDLLERADEDGLLGIDEVAGALRDRFEWCLEEKGDSCEFFAKQVAITFSEAAGFVQVFGANGDATIRADHAQSFLVNEQIPVDWKPSRKTVTLEELTVIADEIQTAAGVVVERKARRHHMVKARTPIKIEV